MVALTPEKIAEFYVLVRQDTRTATGREKALLTALASLLEALGVQEPPAPKAEAPVAVPVPETIPCPHCGAPAKLAPYAGRAWRMCQRGHHFKDPSLLPASA